jgi:hypothetical protein
MKTESGQLRQDSHGRTARTGQSGQVALTEQPGQAREDTLARIWQEGQNSRDKDNPAGTT